MRRPMIFVIANGSNSRPCSAVTALKVEVSQCNSYSVSTTSPDRVPSRWIHASHIGLAAWIVGNAYESLVGVPRLLADARPTRKPGVLSTGSSVRFYADVAPLVLVATGFSLIASWPVAANRRSVVVAGTGLAEALAISAYLIPAVN